MGWHPGRMLSTLQGHSDPCPAPSPWPNPARSRQVRDVQQPRDSQDLFHHTPGWEGLLSLFPKGLSAHSCSHNESEGTCRLLIEKFLCTGGCRSEFQLPSRGADECLSSLKRLWCPCVTWATASCEVLQGISTCGSSLGCFNPQMSLVPARTGHSEVTNPAGWVGRAIPSSLH